jgi:hypothetical protein
MGRRRGRRIDVAEGLELVALLLTEAARGRRRHLMGGVAGDEGLVGDPPAGEGLGDVEGLCLTRVGEEIEALGLVGQVERLVGGGAQGKARLGEPGVGGGEDLGAALPFAAQQGVVLCPIIR